MEISAGLLVIWDNKILLAKPTRAAKKMWGIPKGKLEVGETYLDAAIRETKEEIGVEVPISKISDSSHIINYKNSKSNKTYKRIVFFTVYIDSLSEIGLDSIRVPKEQLQPREIQKARFMTYEEAEEKMFWRQKDVLSFIIKNEVCE